MSVYKDCPDCSGKIVVGLFSTINVPKLDAEGNEHPTERIRLKLPHHAVAVSRFDPTGIVPAPCRHGLAEHPDPEVMADPVLTSKAISWVRAKHLTIKAVQGGLPLPGCPVCFGEPRPADLCEAADGRPVGELMMERLARQ